MSVTEYHRTLGIGEGAFRTLESNLERREYEGRSYRHLPDHRQGVERGTALLDGAVVRGFPKVPRALVLGTGIPAQFAADTAEIAVEEKLNGYNVRVARVDGDVLAFTRSGMICPFTTRLVERRLDLEALFDAHPEAMVCGEMVGPENPYTAHDYPEIDSLAFRAFDWRDRETGEPLPVEMRRERYDRFGVPQVRLFGTYAVEDAASWVRPIVDALDDEGREGVVMKSTDGRTQLKYTTAAANRGDLAYAFSLPFDYGRSFVFRRLVREAFQSVEWDESDAAARERAHDLGEAILLSMRETIDAVDEGADAGDRHTVRAAPEAVDALLEHLCNQGLDLEIEADRREDGDRVCTFLKRTQSTTDKTRNYLEGHIVRE
ncbi:RNA ligase [Natronolimnohabitans innermongolicus]|uniref:ATP dependent DNA ligase n=1 Tax=Natronolimnohabitans innermongolicus JCM 12255 TaxID=1227499 RepID=L9WR82_9EURY|nr:RNA ligase [Natronolimnohabitans innermongolicus]ELY51716.1 ATP dependent DNA ligase [Natronolimnohabitans innermongolicus JCM 12255]